MQDARQAEFELVKYGWGKENYSVLLKASAVHNEGQDDKADLINRLEESEVIQPKKKKMQQDKKNTKKSLINKANKEESKEMEL